MSTVSSFKGMENENDIYTGRDCMKKFCKSWIEQAIKITNFKKNETIN